MASHGSHSEKPSIRASAAPETGCTTTALTVKSASAITTMRAVAAMVAGSRERCAISMKKAIPSPVPNSTAAPRMWISFSVRIRSIIALYSTVSASAILEDCKSEQRRHQHGHDLGQRTERIEPELWREPGADQHIDRRHRQHDQQHCLRCTAEQKQEPKHDVEERATDHDDIGKNLADAGRAELRQRRGAAGAERDYAGRDPE